ncbi:retrovirus-related pol polyprotein from transposon TNT 1-94 [Tanacetum coccineum]
MPVVYDSEETLQLAQESRLKMKQLNKEIKPVNYAKIDQLLGVFVSQKAKSREDLYFSNISKTASVFKSISIPNEEFSDDNTPSVARKFLNEPNLFETSNLLQKKADESVAKHKTLEFEIERLLRVFVKKDIMSIVQSNSVVDTSNLQIELDRMKEKLKNCIIKKEKEYVVLWNSWYTKAYNDMQQKIERLQAQLGDQKGKSQDTPCVSNTLDPLSQKLENENVELEFQVRNYEKEIAHLKTTYKNLFDSISVTRAQTKTIIHSLQNKLQDKVSEQKDTTKGTSTNTKQPNAFQSEHPKFSKTRVPPKVVESNDLSNPVSSNSAPSSRESTVVNNERVIAPGIFRTNPFKASRVDNFVPNKHVKASVRTKLITVSQPHVITKKDVNSNINGFSPKNVESTTRTKRQQPRNNPKNDKVPSRSKSSCLSNNLKKIEENHRSLQSSNQDLDCVDLLKRKPFNKPIHINSHENGLCIPNLLMARATLTKSWLWLQRYPTYFDTITDLAKKTILSPGFFVQNSEYHKDHLCPTLCEQGKKQKAVHPPKPVPPNSSQRNSKIKSLKNTLTVLASFTKASSVRTPQQNGVVERRNRTLVEAARTMLIFSRAPLFLWAEAIATAVYKTYGKKKILEDNEWTRSYLCSVNNNNSKNHTVGDMDLLYQKLCIRFIVVQTSSAQETAPVLNAPQLIGETLSPVLTRNSTRDLMVDMWHVRINGSTVEPKNIKEAMTDPAWIESMQEELL